MTTPTKKYFLKSISNSHIMGLYVIHLEPIDKYVHTPPWLPRKLYPIPVKWPKSLTVFRPNGAKTLPFGAAHT